VIGGVMLAGLFGVVRGMIQVAFGNMRMMTGLFMISRFVVLRGCSVMFSGVFVVFCCLAMMRRRVFRHLDLSL
jgi:hypothetical protein